MKIRNRSRDAIQGKIQRQGVIEEVQFQPGISQFSDDTVLLTSHPKLKVVDAPKETPASVVTSEPVAPPPSTDSASPRRKPPHEKMEDK